MNRSWPTAALADLCTTFADGDWIESKDQSTDGIRLLQTGNVGEGVFKDRAEKARYVSEETFKRLRCTEIFSGDCLISRLPDPVGRACLVPELDDRLITAVDCTIVRFKSQQMQPEFFCYYSQSIEYLRAVAAECSGTTRLRISRARLGQTIIPVPEIAEQRRIVEILDEAFEAIGTAKGNAERSLGCSADLAAALEQECFDSYIDTEFSADTLDSLCELIVDCEHKTAPTQDSGYPSIRTPNIGRGELILDGVNRVSKETYLAWTRRARPRPGDLILAREAPAGNVAVIPPGLDVCLGQRTVLIRPKADVLLSEYLAHLLLQNRSQAKLLAHSRGATVQHINLKDIRAFQISGVPDLSSQRIVIDRLAEIDELRRAAVNVRSRKIAVLDELKKSLLHHAFTGQLTAKKTDQLLGAAV